MNKTRKSVLVFLTDDHAQWALGCYGNKKIRTPNIDYLADSGMVFENAFTPTPVCSPARACFHTGRIASQHGIHDFLGTEAGSENSVDSIDWLADEITMAEIFQREGYRTGIIGKWHLGQETNKHRGFDHCFCLGPGYPMEHGEDHVYYEDGNPVRLSGYKTQVISDRAEKFLESTPEDKPFFLFVGHYATHSPWNNHPERLVSAYRRMMLDEPFLYESFPFGEQVLESTNPTRKNPREALAQYYAAVSQIDESVGRILDTLHTLERLDTTQIIYTSDHGLNCGHHGIWGKGNGTLPLNIVDESIRIPMVLRDPDLPFTGAKRSEYIDHTDLFQTIIESMGIDIGKHSSSVNSYPGRSFFEYCKKENWLPEERWRTHQFCEYGNVRMVRTPNFKLLLRHSIQEDQFFDLKLDPRETTNRISDPSYKEIIGKLRNEIVKFYSEYEVKEKSGLNICELPHYNNDEAWRDLSEVKG